MMLSADRVQETSSTVGTVAIALAGATLTSMNTFASAFADGSLVGYVVLNQAVQTEWEKGIGTYSANSIARTYVTGGSNGTSPVNFSAGTKLVMSVAPQSKSAQAYDPTQVYAPGDTVQVSGVVWYSMAVNVGSAPSTSNANWAAMGGGSGGGGVSMLAGPGLVLNTLTNVIRLAVSGDVQIASTGVSIPNTGTGSIQLQATGGQLPFSWASGALPTGITLAASGTLSYNGAQVDGTDDVTFTVTDAAGRRSSNDLVIHIGAVSGPRYWRVHASNTSGGWNEVAITELVFKDANGTILTSPANATANAYATSVNNSGTAASNAFDSNSTTYWMSLTATSGDGVGQHGAIGWDFGALGAAVKTIVITGGGGAATGSSASESPSAFTIETSDDKTTWTVAGSFTSTGWASAETRTFSMP